ncbi:hypothetical protein FPQ18DRAFT_409534 [Pyronema domesticum]|nr:hypothetical protein FPQ18DRAFT_409534 [Pyronema domesticum]
MHCCVAALLRCCLAQSAWDSTVRGWLIAAIPRRRQRSGEGYASPKVVRYSYPCMHKTRPVHAEEKQQQRRQDRQQKTRSDNSISLLKTDTTKDTKPKNSIHERSPERTGEKKGTSTRGFLKPTLTPNSQKVPVRRTRPHTGRTPGLAAVGVSRVLSINNNINTTQLLQPLDNP